MYRLNVQVTGYGWQTVPDRGVIKSCDPLQNFGSSNHITGKAERKVVKFCTRVGYINSSNRMNISPTTNCGYSHVTVLKFCRFSWWSAWRGFVSDSLAILVSLTNILPSLTKLHLSPKPATTTFVSFAVPALPRFLNCLYHCYLYRP